MIIADQFIWLHIPKAGDTHTRRLFSYFADIVIDQSCSNPMQPGGKDYKHDTISVRSGTTHVATEGKKILVNIRRLPSFIVSHSIHIIEILGHCYKIQRSKKNPSFV